MKKALIITLVLALSIGIASFAMADDTSTTTQPPIPGRCGVCPQLKMTDDQKAQMNSLMTQMLELRKQVIQDNVTNGTITQDQADNMLKMLNVHLEAVKSGDFGPEGGLGFKGGGRGGHFNFKQKGQPSQGPQMSQESQES